MLSIFGTSKNTSSKSSLGTGRNAHASLPARKTVYVGLSGGVDSAVSAALLQDAGYDVTGVFIKVWQPDSADCGWKDERRDAMRVAAALDIPFETLDLSAQYKKEVADYMISEYAAGRTPNPDVMCNRHVKFGSFLDEARRRGIDYVATGHYARNIKHDEKAVVFSGALASSEHSLCEGTDKAKDQSYFLWTLGQDDLRHVLFPVGHLKKSQVRKLAEKYRLPVFDKKDSQGVCFIGHLDMKSFLKEYVHVEKGSIINESGDVIGEHDGALLYTIGERRGLRISNTQAASEPHFVIRKDVKNNILVAAPQSALEGRLAELAPKSALISDVRWVSGTAPESGVACEARIRYRQERQSCRIFHGADTKAGKDSGGAAGVARIEFDSHQKGMAEGQSVVLYDGETCLGGGIISA